MDPAILELLVCPISRSKLRIEGDFLVSERGAIRYPITDGIPQLLPLTAIFPPDAPTPEAFKARYLSP